MFLNHGKIGISVNPEPKPIDIHLPASKSESNRVLIISALSQHQPILRNLSTARDTQIMMDLLNSNEKVLDVKDAGTTMRFLTSYCALTGKNNILTGTSRMHERPIHILVEALKTLGADINYLKSDGYPPIETLGFRQQLTDHISMGGHVSSQYISSLLMSAPVLPMGLTLHLTGKIASRPYIDMTIELMRSFNASVQWLDNRTIKVDAKPYRATAYTVESDWSGASYWYGIASLAKTATMKLLGLKKDSLQGDIRIAEIMKDLGVETIFESDGIRLRKNANKSSVQFDFSDCPDLAQTVVVICAAKNVQCEMTGLESLRIKETDRIAALQTEIAKIGAKLVENEGKWTLFPADKNGPLKLPIEIETYKDHRMAMAFSILATLYPVIIKNPEVVQKSYPSFWNDLIKTGFEIKTSN